MCQYVPKRDLLNTVDCRPRIDINSEFECSWLCLSRSISILCGILIRIYHYFCRFHRFNKKMKFSTYVGVRSLVVVWFKRCSHFDKFHDHKSYFFNLNWLVVGFWRLIFFWLLFLFIFSGFIQICVVIIRR